MFFGIKRENSSFFIWCESCKIRSFAPNECNARPYTRKNEKFFLTLNRLIYSG